MGKISGVGMRRTLQICLIGPFTVFLDGKLIFTHEGARQRSRHHRKRHRELELLAFLAFQIGEPQGVCKRKEIAAKLWGGIAGDVSLRQALFRLRPKLKDAGVDPEEVLRTSGDALELTSSRSMQIEVDIATLRGQLRSASPEEIFRLLRRPPEEFLSGWHSDWIEETRIQLNELFRSEIHELLMAYTREVATQRSAYMRRAIVGRSLRRAIATTDLGEDVYRSLLDGLGKQRKYRSADRLYRSLRRCYERGGHSNSVDRAKVQRAIEPETAALSDRLRAEARARQSSPTHGNVPVPPRAPTEDFTVRRQCSVEHIIRLLDGRLVVLTGAGGIGKSWLASNVAYRLNSEFEDGAWWIQLGDVQNPALVVEHMYASLALPTHRDIPPEKALVLELQDQERLLIFDTCEHVLEAAATVANVLLRSCPNLCVLATSREAFPTYQDQATWSVPTLGLPEMDARSLGDLISAEASRLFLHYATKAWADFKVSRPTDIAAVVSICERLDGLPLAIELAACRVPLLNLSEIERQLADRLSFLVRSASVGMLPHQTTLRATIQWSYDALTLGEQTLFRRLAVFAGPYTIADVVAVCCDEGIATKDVLEMMASLLGKSLIGRDHDSSDDTRYFLLYMIREFAASQLANTQEEAEVRHKHALYSLSAAERYASAIRTPSEANALASWQRALRNLVEAMGWAEHSGDVELLAQLAWLVGVLHARIGFLDEAQRTIDAGIAAAQNLNDLRLYASLLRESAGIAFDKHELDLARSLADQAHVMCASHDAVELGKTENLLGEIARRQGRLEDARTHLQSSLDCFQRCGTDLDVAIALNNLGLLEIASFQTNNAHSLIQAQDNLSRALRIRQKAGDKRGAAETVTNLGILAHLTAKYSEAETHYKASLWLETQIGHTFGVARALNNLGEIAAATGNQKHALRLLLIADSLFELLASPYRSHVEIQLSSLDIRFVNAEHIRITCRMLYRRGLDELANWALDETGLLG